MTDTPQTTPKRVWRATCGVDGSSWVAEMKDDDNPCHSSFCPDCRERKMIAPGVLNWRAEELQNAEP